MSKAKPLKAKCAWLVTWAGTGPPKELVVAVLNHRLGRERVREIVEQLHIVLMNYTPAEKLRCANQAANNPYRADCHPYDRICCGHNPWLYARRVTELMIRDGELTWTEPPTPAQMRQQLVDLGLIIEP
jgi:hypothetical protein